MDSKYQDCARIMKALSSAIRLQIIDMLSHGEMCACAIQEHFEMSQSTVSYHMKQLCDCDLVLARNEGKWTRYKLSKEGCGKIMAIFKAITTLNTTAEESIYYKE